MFDSVPDQYKIQEMCDKIASDHPFKLKYCHDRYKTQEMCNKAIDDFLPALKFVPDWFITSKMTKKLLAALYTERNINILYINAGSGDSVFSFNRIGIFSIDLSNINLDDTNFDADDPETFIHIRLLAWHIKFESHKALKIELNDELMLLAWHPRRWWNFCMAEDETKEIEPMFME